MKPLLACLGLLVIALIPVSASAQGFEIKPAPTPQFGVSFTYACDANHNLVYVTNTGAIFVLPHWDGC